MRYCRRCNKEIEKGRSVYCSEECRKLSRKEQQRDFMRRYRLKNKDKMKTKRIERYLDKQTLIIPQWYTKNHIEEIIGKKLTQEEFYEFKDKVMNNDYLSEIINTTIIEIWRN